MVEHGTENAGVASSTLALGTAPAPGADDILSERKWLSGRASPCQGEGRGFESHLPLQSPLFRRLRLITALPVGAERLVDKADTSVLYLVRDRQGIRPQGFQDWAREGCYGAVGR